MKTKLLTFVIHLLCINIYAQIGVNTSNPNATLEVVSSTENTSLADGIIAPKLTGENLKNKDDAYLVNQTGAIVYVTEALTPDNTSPKTINVNEIGYYYFDGIIWQKFRGDGGDSSLSAINGLTKVGNNIKLGGTLTEITTINTDSINTLRLNGLQDIDASNGKILIIDNDNNVKFTDNISSDLSIPTPAVFRLEANQNNFLNGAAAGGKFVVNMDLIKNSITGLTYDATTRTISLPSGTYQMIFVYEATHNAPNCTNSSYIVDFPNTTGIQRIHSTAFHNVGNSSSHGGTITYTTIIDSPRTWRIELGRGQSGNCTGAGMILIARSTHLLIYRIGDN